MQEKIRELPDADSDEGTYPPAVDESKQRSRLTTYLSTWSRSSSPATAIRSTRTFSTRGASCGRAWTPPRRLSHPTRSAALRAGTTRPPAEMTALRRQRRGITTAVLAGDSTRALLDAMPAAVAQACRSVGQG